MFVTPVVVDHDRHQLLGVAVNVAPKFEGDVFWICPRGTVELERHEQVVDDFPEGQPVVLVLDDACEESLLDVALGLKYFKYVHLNNIHSV